MDHFFDKKRTSVAECWMLRTDCHAEKTGNWPSKIAWLEKFIAHCQRHNYADARADAETELYTAKTSASLVSTMKGRA
jgi:hypothetical protein